MTVDLNRDALEVARDLWASFVEDLDEGWDRYFAFFGLWEYANQGDTCTTCREATRLLVEFCPELTRVRGHVKMVGAPDDDERPWSHWWCVTSSGEVVDPTRSQFPCRDLVYVPIDESRGEPTGKCPNCGGVCYEHRFTCCDECEREFVESMGL